MGFGDFLKDIATFGGHSYRKALAQEIKAMGDQHYADLYDVPEVQELDPDVARHFWQYVQGETDSPDRFHRAARQADIDKRLAKRLEQLADNVRNR